MLITYSKEQKSFTLSNEDREIVMGAIALLRLLRNADMVAFFKDVTYHDYESALSLLKTILKIENENLREWAEEGVEQNESN